MSLKAFHLLFIAISALLGAGFALWCFLQYRNDQGTSYLLAAAASVVVGTTLVGYGLRFAKKFKEISYL